jgi:peptide/nickel transport system substrate-binding protein
MRLAGDSASGDGRLAVISRRELLRASGVGLAGLLASGLLGACSGTEADGQRGAGGEATATGSSAGAAAGGAAGPVITGQSFAPTTLDPHTSSEIGGLTVLLYVYETLYGPDVQPPYDTIPVLAAGEPDEVEESVYRISLRDGATFHDGTPVNARAVVQSIERLRAEETASFLAQYLSFIDTVSEVDDTTIEVRTAFPTQFVKERIGLVRIVPESLAAPGPSDSFDTEPIGSGPYMAASIGSDLRSFRFERHDDYNGPVAPQLDDIGMDVILSDQARISALQTGRVLAMTDPPYQAVEQIDGEPSLSAGGAASFQQSLLIFNCSDGPFTDARVRRAFIRAINKDAITEAVFFGRATPATSYLPENHSAYVRPSTDLSYDVDAARQLLSDAGAENLQFELLVSNLGWLSAQAPLVQADLQAAGMDVTIREGEVESLVPVVTSGDYAAWLTVTDPTVFGNTDAEFLMRWIYKGAIPDAFNFWEAPEKEQIGDLLDRALQETSSDGLKAIYADLQNIIADQAPSFPLHHRELLAAWKDDLNLTPDPVYGVNLLQVELS